MFKREIKQFNAGNIKPRNVAFLRENSSEGSYKHLAVFSRAVIVFLILTFLALPNVFAQQHKDVLVLASYHRTFRGTKLIVRAIETELEMAGVNLDIEYLDTKQYRNQTHFDNLFYLYKNKSRQKKYDVIITIDNNALLFLLMHRDQLWPDVPIVFCGVDRYHTSLYEGKPADTTIQDVLQGNKLVTGVTEGFDYTTTIETALKIHPYLKHIFLINDGVNPVPYWPNLTQADASLLTEKFQGRLEFIPFLLTEQNTDELIGVTKQHEEDGLLLFVNNFVDERGDFVLKDKIFSQFWQNCGLPIYVVSTSLLETEYPVGGYITGSSEQGKIAVDMAIRIIKGENPDDIPIANMAFSYIFNYHQLKKFGIPLSALPPQSTILRQPESLYYKYKARIWAVIVLVVGLSFMVIALLANTIRRKKVETALKESEYKYRALFEISADGIIIAEANTKKFLYANPAACSMFGYRVDELAGLCVDLIHPHQSLDYVIEQFTMQAKGIKKLAQDIPCLRKDGSLFYADITAASAVIEQKKCLIGFFRDITERKNAEEGLKNASERLEQRVQQRTKDLARAVSELKIEIDERNKAEKKLLEYQKQLRSLASELAMSEERLRRKIAVDVHDGLGQNLAISKIKIESLAHLTSSEKLKNALNEVSGIIGKTIQSTRNMTFELSPPVLYELGLEAAIEWLVRQAKERDGLAAVFQDDKILKPVTDNVKIILFQAVRELLVNVVKHAKAKKVKVDIQHIDSIIRIRIKDDGVGFDVAKTDFYDYRTSGFGLFNIRERLGQIGGKIDIDSVTGKGTVVTLEASIDHNKENLNMEP